MFHEKIHPSTSAPIVSTGQQSSSARTGHADNARHGQTTPNHILVRQSVVTAEEEQALSDKLPSTQRAPCTNAAVDVRTPMALPVFSGRAVTTGRDQTSERETTSNILSPEESTTHKMSFVQYQPSRNSTLYVGEMRIPSVSSTEMQTVTNLASGKSTTLNMQYLQQQPTVNILNSEEKVIPNAAGQRDCNVPVAGDDTTSNVLDSREQATLIGATATRGPITPNQHMPVTFSNVSPNEPVVSKRNTTGSTNPAVVETLRNPCLTAEEAIAQAMKALKMTCSNMNTNNTSFHGMNNPAGATPVTGGNQSPYCEKTLANPASGVEGSISPSMRNGDKTSNENTQLKNALNTISVLKVGMTRTGSRTLEGRYSAV